MEIRTTGDLTQLSDFKDIVEGMDAVIHLAARVHVMRDTATAPELAFRQANTDVTQHLAQAAAAAGTGRFVFLSSVKGKRRSDDRRRAVFGAGRAGARRRLWAVQAGC